MVSRPFTMAFHALIGSGFLAATFLVRPFLPSSEVRLDKTLYVINVVLRSYHLIDIMKRQKTLKMKGLNQISYTSGCHRGDLWMGDLC